MLLAGDGHQPHTLNRDQREEKKFYATDRFAISIISSLPLPVERCTS